ncbi:hypothetical protein C8R47DRAFT_1062602 [Mycena vitilis]|nr:hypothetical protein C8R47DRAFT_1062602 [Mycena vitilis]
MPRGRPPLDAETKAARTQGDASTIRLKSASNYSGMGTSYARRHERGCRRTVSVYGYSSNSETLLRLRERPKEDEPPELQLRKRASAAKYRESALTTTVDSHRKEILRADRLRRAKSYIDTNGLEAFDEKEQRGQMSKTQKSNEGRPAYARQRVPPHKRFNPQEILTDNQIRCRALRSCGLEEDNGDDSDEDLPRGMCGCDRTECQLLHKNETADRKEWKLFHIKYRQELENGF